MKITIINNSSDIVTGPGYTYVDPGETKEYEGRSALELDIIRGEISASDVLVLGEMEGADKAPIICTLKDPGDPAGGDAVQSGEGFDLLTEAGAAANVQTKMYFGLFDDEDCTVPAENATVTNAATGTIDSGVDTNVALVTPDATGEFSCDIADSEDEKVYIRAWPKADQEYTVECIGIEDVTFSA